MKKILIVFGTRPEAIKMIPIILELRKHACFKTSICVTAQHRSMLDQVLKFFDITADFDLDIMRPNQDLFTITSDILVGMKNILEYIRPDIVLVHGDTTTSFAASLAAFYSKVRIAHVEAGLRTWDLSSPWPEEANRQLTDRLSDIFFAPTLISKNNLLKEGVDANKIYITGNTVIDALKLAINKIDSDKLRLGEIETNLVDDGYFPNKERKFILITGHRRENFGIGFINICNAIKDLSIRYPDIDFVYPVHLNPNVQEPVNSILSARENVFLINPQNYGPFVYLLRECYLILTDSGGIQEEAPSLGKPVLVMRDTTERPEAVDAGIVELVGTDFNKIISRVSFYIENPHIRNIAGIKENPYGSGDAAKLIVNELKKFV